MKSRAELRKLAEAALAGADNDAMDWYDEIILNELLIVEETKANGPYIAAVSPATMIARLDETDSLLEFCRRFVHCDMECYKHGDGPAPEGSGGHYPDCAITQREALLAKMAA